MKYRTMNRTELAIELDISRSTLIRRMKKLDPAFLEHIKNRSLLFENEIKYIHDNIEWRAPWEIGLDEQTRNSLSKEESPS